MKKLDALALQYLREHARSPQAPVSMPILDAFNAGFRQARELSAQTAEQSLRESDIWFCDLVADEIREIGEGEAE